MEKLKTILNNFYNDIVIVAFSLLTYIIIITIISMIINGNGIVKMAGGVYVGVGLGIITFYYLRGLYTLIFTILQIIFNSIITTLQVYCIYILLGDINLLKFISRDLLVVLSIPIFLAINKQLLDYISSKLNFKRRGKNPVKIA